MCSTAWRPVTTWIRAAERYLGLTTIHYEDVTGKGAKQISFSQVALDQATAYAAEDADITLRLHRHLWPQIAAQTGTEKPLRRHRAAAGAGAAAHGALWRADRPRHAAQAEPRAGGNHGAARGGSASSEAGQPFNLDSPKQLQHILYEKMQIPVSRKTATGQPSTAEDVLEELAGEHALPRLILRVPRRRQAAQHLHREAAGADRPGQRPRAHQLSPGRRRNRSAVSSSDPNLQNIPIRTPEGRRIRQAFIAPPGHRAVSCRLFADRAAHHGASVRRRRPASRLCRGSRHSPGHRGRSVRRSARRRHGGAAPLGQGDQLRI